MAVASGAKGLEAGVVLGDEPAVRETDLDALRDLAGSGMPVHHGNPAGALHGSEAT